MEKPVVVAQAEPINLPENIGDLKSGTKYRLNGVNFEQSKAVLIAGSENSWMKL